MLQGISAAALADPPFKKFVLLLGDERFRAPFKRDQRDRISTRRESQPCKFLNFPEALMVSRRGARKDKKHHYRRSGRLTLLDRWYVVGAL